MDLTASALAAAPFRLSGCEQLLHSGCAPAAAYALRGSGSLLTKPAGVTEMRHVDRNEEMRAIVGYVEVAIERLDLRPRRAL